MHAIEVFNGLIAFRIVWAWQLYRPLCVGTVADTPTAVAGRILALMLVKQWVILHMYKAMFLQAIWNTTSSECKDQVDFT
jgi:hypothetical protein